MKKMTKGRLVFQIINYTVLIFLSLLCLFPLLNILAMSFSSATAVSAGRVSVWPVEFNTYAYSYVIGKRDFWNSLLKSVERVCIGVPFSMLITILVAYPLSKERTQLRLRSFYSWIFFFTMLFSGGLIPGYLLIQNLHLMDTIWALILPMAVPVYNIVLMLNFFRGIPRELEEAALIDGANQFQTCFRIYVPCAKPSIATLTLFCFITHWNSYFDGMIYLSDRKLFPLQVILREILSVAQTASSQTMSAEDAVTMAEQARIADLVKYVIMIVATAPVMLIYPFVQKYFVKGVMIGSIKG